MATFSMDTSSNALRGWTIPEAIERTFDPGNLVDPASGNEAIASRQKMSLLDWISKGQLVATGCFETQAALRVPLDAQDLLAFDWSGSQLLTLSRTSAPEVEVFDVRVFPVLRAPKVGNYLNGLSLATVFRRFVINDPEVVALAKRLSISAARYSAVFLEGQLPGPFGGFHWPLDSTASELAFRFVASPFGDREPEPSTQLNAVSGALADRLGALRDLLVSGDIAACGTFVQTGVDGPIGRLQWNRSNMSIEVSNGDLCEGHDYRAIPKWTGLSLRRNDLSATPNQPHDIWDSKVAESSRKGKTQIQTKEKCRIECLAWLEGMMGASTELGKFSKSELWAQAQNKWPNKLSFRGFEAARTEAIHRTGALAWKEPGRPKGKSSHS